MDLIFKKLLIYLTIILLPTIVKAQTNGWKSFLTGSDTTGGLMEVNVDLKQKAPISNQPFLVITALKMNTHTENGVASKEEMLTLQSFSISVQSLLCENSSYSYAGNYTHKGVRINYFYTTDTLGLRLKLATMYAVKYPTYNLGLNFKYEDKWQTYFNFIYPGVEVIETLKKEYPDLPILNER